MDRTPHALAALAPELRANDLARKDQPLGTGSTHSAGRRAAPRKNEDPHRENLNSNGHNPKIHPTPTPPEHPANLARSPTVARAPQLPTRELTKLTLPLPSPGTIKRNKPSPLTLLQFGRNIPIKKHVALS